ncbi:PEP-CTERM sorting domain-containing protein [Thalassotalea sp. G2M2-11]|uniref:PEP-CTERM sorting domain-containing protein n=1 Tax=Thalassotalea sp. G2M2-11 TaxID=2787627 RepID=UPI001F495CB2|nr:PEP-CTERM sorting domain-containing protein [Thalassotalea sp. G2M2-11]
MKSKVLSMIASSLLFVMSSVANAGLIVTAVGDDSSLQEIVGLDLGSFGIVDIDFGGRDFNEAFGTELVPTGFLFASSEIEAISIITAVRDLINTYNLTSITNINRVVDSTGTLGKTTYLDIGYDITATTVSVYQAYAGSSSSPFRIVENYSRDGANLNYIRMTRSSTDVPEPSTLAIFALGMMGLASRRFKKQS